MANIPSPAKSASKWGRNELEAFNIVVRDAPISTFFATQSLELPPSPFAGTTVLNYESSPPEAELSLVESDLFYYMKHLEQYDLDSYVSAVNDFTQSLLSMLGFTSKHRKIRHRPTMHFTMSGVEVDACPQMTLVNVNERGVVFLVEADKLYKTPEGPEPQWIAGAIAAFYENSARWRGGRLAYQTILGVTMTGTAPIFYRVTLTEKLLQDIEQGFSPLEETLVFRFVPPVPNLEDYLESPKGMRPLINRQIVFKCFEGLKTLLTTF